jgi:hypothetical protein
MGCERRAAGSQPDHAAHRKNMLTIPLDNGTRQTFAAGGTFNHEAR